MWKMQAPMNGVWVTVRGNLTTGQVDVLRQTNIDDGYVEDVDFRFVPMT